MESKVGPSLIDTDALSEVIKGRNAIAVRKGAEYLTQHGSFTFSLMTRYEVLRGLKAKGATAQLQRFETRCQRSTVLPVSDEIIVRAADLYADLKRRGELLPDADLIIAATALVHGLTLVTSNTAHYKRISGLDLDCWSTE